MPKATKGATAPPERNAGRKSIRQAEVLEALEMLKTGQGEVVKDKKDREFLVLELDMGKVEDFSKAKAALYNLRWRFNPKNKTTGGDEAEFERLFSSAGHGGVKIYESNDKVYLSAPTSYASGKAPAKTTRKAPAKKSRARVRKVQPETTETATSE